MKTIHIKQMALVGLMTAVICVIAPFSITIPFSPVPLSLTTLAIHLAIMVLGTRRGVLSVAIYLCLGLVGLPVFSGFTGGIGKLLGPTGGYLLGYLLLAFVSGFLASKKPGNIPLSFLGMLLGMVMCYLFGMLWLAYQSNLSLTQAFLSSVLPFLPGDITKLVIALPTGMKLRKRLAQADLL